MVASRQYASHKVCALGLMVRLTLELKKISKLGKLRRICPERRCHSLFCFN